MEEVKLWNKVPYGASSGHLELISRVHKGAAATQKFMSTNPDRQLITAPEEE